MNRERLYAPVDESGEGGAGKPMTPEDMRQAGEQLRKKVEAAKAQKALDKKNKLSERESLLADYQRTLDLLPEATSTVEYFEALDKARDLDSSGKDQLEQFRATVAGLEKQAATASERISVISYQPEINTELHAQAAGEHKTREANRIKNEGVETLSKEIDQLFKDLKAVTDERYRLREQLRQQEEVSGQKYSAVDKERDKARSLITKNYEFANQLSRYDREPTWSAYRARLQELRKGLGLFKGQEKAAVDHMLQPRVERLFQESDQAMAERDKTRQTLEATKQKVDELKSRYKDIAMKGWEADDKIMAIWGEEPVGFSKSQVVFGISQHSDTAYKRITQERHWEQDSKGKQVEVGRYKEWHEAVRDNPELVAFYDLWQEVNQRGNLIYNRPKVEAKS